MLTYPLFLRIHRMCPSEGLIKDLIRVTGLSREQISECFYTSKVAFMAKHKIDPLYAYYCDNYFIPDDEILDPLTEMSHSIMVRATMKLLKADLASGTDFPNRVTPEQPYYESYQAGRISFEENPEETDRLLDLLEYEYPTAQMNELNRSYLEEIDEISECISYGDYSAFARSEHPYIKRLERMNEDSYHLIIVATTDSEDIFSFNRLIIPILEEILEDEFDQ